MTKRPSTSRRGPILVIALMGACGLSLVLFAQATLGEGKPGHFLQGLLTHFGDALMIASILALLWHTTEMVEFFSALATETMIDNRFLKRLKPEALQNLRFGISEALVAHAVDNPRHRWKDLHAWMDSTLFDTCLPTAQTESVYRENFDEVIVLRFVSLSEALAELKVDSSGVDTGALDLALVRIETITSYSVISPRIGRPKTYKKSMRIQSTDLRGMPLKDRFTWFAGSSREEAVRQALVAVDVPHGGVEVTGEVELQMKDGIADVWERAIEYHAAAWSPYVVTTMSVLTHGGRLHVSVDGASAGLKFDGDAIGFGRGDQVQYLSHGIQLAYPGWLLEDHGFVVWWWREDHPNAESVSPAPRS
jgi:hypothetical protein